MQKHKKKRELMRKVCCPNCRSFGIRPHGFKSYDPGYKMECRGCGHCFNQPATRKTAKG